MRRIGGPARKTGIFPLASAVAFGALAVAVPAEAWHRWGHHPRVVIGPGWSPSPFGIFPAALPVPGYRLFHPPGLPLSYQNPSSGATYCFSPTTGFYFVCGYSGPAWESAGPATPPGLGGPSPPGEEMPAPPSGILLFRLPEGAEASVDAEPVGLAGGLGAAAVSPGPHRVVLRIAGRETAETVAVTSHAVLTLTPVGVSPAGP